MKKILLTILFVFIPLVGFSAQQTINNLETYLQVRTKMNENFTDLYTNKQAADADLTTYAGITPSANVQSFLSAADYAAMWALLGGGTAGLLDSGTSIGNVVLWVDDGASNPSIPIGTFNPDTIAGYKVNDAQLTLGAFSDYGVVPSGTNPITDAAGELAVDTDDEFIEFYTSSSRVIPAKFTAQMTIWDPDAIQAVEDAVPLLAVEADWAPHGITIVDCGWKSDAAATQTVGFEEWTDPADVAPSTIEDVAGTTVTEQADDGTLADSAVAAGTIVMIDLPTTGLNYLHVWMTYYINPGD